MNHHSKSKVPMLPKDKVKTSIPLVPRDKVKAYIPLAREGYPFITGAFLAALFLFYIGFLKLGWVFVVLTGFVVFFFRDPNRKGTGDKNLILAPADGRIVKIEKGREHGQDGYWVSIFLSIFNVHVNRMPVSGEIVKYHYNAGRFLPAFRPKASLLNEQNTITIRSQNGLCFQIKQIAGLIARRIVCYVKEGDILESGERFGLIRFGSRVDIFLPSLVQLTIKVGDKVKGGITTVGKIAVDP